MFSICCRITDPREDFAQLLLKAIFMLNQPISIYLELKPGETAELAIVARAALDLDRAFRELAFLFDPSAKVQLDLVEGEVGSLNLKAIIRGATDRKTLTGVAAALALTVMSDIRGYSVGKVIDYITGQSEDAQSLSDDDIDRIARKVVEVSKAPQVQKPVRQFYKEISSDQSITGVGASLEEDAQRPEIIIPRSDFLSRSGETSEVDDLTAPSYREEIETKDLVLISPVLLEKESNWKFAFDGQSFSARMKDLAFLARLLSGRERVSMVAGVILTVRMETVSEMAGGVWIVKKRSILEVLTVGSKSQQGRLNLLPKDGDQ
ncbi:hypothetical protein [Pseudogemmobacter faecipullorum]|uniref:Uncharacterized protein n=1 Tax=Pseudogemmobacter faecipullorum TaxID=2755041 RepID=A0ABS8CQ43_9RHOB|nr:hypothetical protein [Pseudogemmobacter faecipullorum]MCB5411504.1 hypothetical protein [Pseudogemmobacter faecipullorum]